MVQKVTVVGAGILGASAAYQLARAGAEVTVLDAGIAAATDASFGWINASFYLNEDHFRLRHEAIAAYRRLQGALDIPVSWCGCLCWERSGEELDAQRDELAQLGYRVEVLDRAAFAARAPAIANPPERCLFFEGEAAAEAGALAEALLKAAVDLGAKVVSGARVDTIATENGRVTGLATNAGPLEADQVVLAVGTATQELLAGVGMRLPMLSRPALVLQTKPVPRVIDHILVSEIGELRQLPGGALLFPTTVGHQGDDSATLSAPPLEIAEAALERIRTALPGVAIELDRVMLGFRPMPEDGLPVVGPVLPGLYAATMHSGITLGALVGELIAAEVLEGITNETNTWLAPYRIDRFAP